MSVFTNPSTGTPNLMNEYDELAVRAVHRAKDRIKEILRENPDMLQLYKKAIAELEMEKNKTE